ncbi:MAG: cytochrome c maturation protein CcmE [Acidimicrobiales bacterium]
MDVTPRTVDDGGAPHIRRRRSPLVYVIAVVIVVAIGGVLFQFLNNAALYYRNADEAVRDRSSLGTKRFRVQGVVQPGVQTSGEDVSFSIAFNGSTIDVRHHGDPPELFKAETPVVLEGHWDQSGQYFDSDTILIKHSAKYIEDNPDRGVTS